MFPVIVLFRHEQPPLQVGLMPTNSIRSVHGTEEVVYITQCDQTTSQSPQLQQHKIALTRPSFYSMQTSTGDAFDPAHLGGAIVLDNLGLHQPPCEYGWTHTTTEDNPPTILRRLPNPNADFLRYKHFDYDTEENEAGHELCVDPPQITTYINPIENMEEETPTVVQLLEQQARISTYASPQELGQSQIDRYSVQHYLHRGASTGDMVIHTGRNNPGHLQLLHFPPFAPDPFKAPLGGTISYMDEKKNEFKCYSHINTNGEFVSAEIDTLTGKNRFGIRARTPPMITAGDKLPMSPTYTPPGSPVDEGFEDATDSNGKFICTPVLQMY